MVWLGQMGTPDAPTKSDGPMIEELSEYLRTHSVIDADEDFKDVTEALARDVVAFILTQANKADALGDAIRRRLEAESELRAARREIHELRTLLRHKTEGGIGWQPITEAPKDGTVIVAPMRMRWKWYPPDSEQYQNGHKGRWVQQDTYGKWVAPRGGQPSLFTFTEQEPGD